MSTNHDADLDTILRTWRHDLHRHPETAFTEHATAERVAGILTDLGFDVTTGIGGTGLVGSLTRGRSQKAIGLRADMDGLPLTEREDRDHRSHNDGAMHACGHDGHMTMVLGAAKVLAEFGGFDGTVRVVFQPAEEPGKGALAMLADGLAARFPMDAIFGLHNIPGLPTGQIHVRPGAIMASEDNFTISITGRGGHASAPHLVIDPLVVAAEIILALQSIVARNVDPQHAAVLSCTTIETDGSRNAIPGQVVIKGDTRTFDTAVSALLEERMRAIVDGICTAHGAKGTVTYTHEFEPTINDPQCTADALAAARAALGPEAVIDDCAPIMASEDFAAFARAIPACFAFIGNGTELGRGGTPLHSRDYDFNDDILRAGVDYYVTLVRQALPEGMAR